MQSNAGTVTDISPVVGGVTFGPEFSRSIHSCPINRQAMVLIGTGTGTAGRGLWVSNNGGSSWIQRIAPPGGGISYLHCAMARDNDQVFYLWGGNGIIAYSTDFGVTIRDKTGNISSFSPGGMCGICGG